MHLFVTRDKLSEKSTMGMLDIDGVFLCYTLEPAIEGVPYAAIPDGIYSLTLEMSYHFRILTPHVNNVPGRTEIEIHPGNYPMDTKGCLLVGQSRGGDAVFNSRDAFETLMRKLQATKEALTIQYNTLK